MAKMEKVTSGQYTNSYCTSVNFLFLPLCCGCTKMLTLREVSKVRTIRNCSDFIFAAFLYFFISSNFKINKSIKKNLKAYAKMKEILVEA